ncbi:MAG: choice-of-anchor Q domain-containing protein [Kiritimatiellae bacterium]|nr:choice-of-anchor Q domain-containing protein [Kiritimatiellia bacterium]
MRTATRWGLFSVMAAIVVVSARADIHYVAQAGQTPSGTYTSWETAASNIQDAVTAAVAGDVVMVSNGVYETGGTLVSGCTITNRVYINKDITVRSADNDPAGTIIKGAKDPVSGGNGPAVVRPVYMTAGSLVGFTVSDGATASNTATFLQTPSYVGGGVYCSSTTPSLSNCVIVGNQSQCNGGGVFQGNMNACRIIGNSTVGWDGHGGGGAYGGILFNSTVASNSVVLVAGHYGGGVQNSVVSNCTIVSNQAGDGGGTSGGTVYNSLIAGNHAARLGGGSLLGNFYNCTIVGNRADSSMGGVGSSLTQMHLINCIVYNNDAPTHVNWSRNSTAYIHLTNSCAAPAPDAGWLAGDGNTAADPQFRFSGSGFGTNLVQGNYRLSLYSPCLNTGTNRDWMTVDLDGNPRILDGIVDMGAYEGGLSTTHYVAQAGQTPAGTYTSWETAASNIQDAVTVAVAGDVVMVSNGVYETGGTLVSGCTITNRVYINKNITVRSADNDPAGTIIKGAKDPVSGGNGPAVVRPVYMTAGSLVGFTVSGGATASNTATISQSPNYVGGGVYCSSTTPALSNCVIIGNQSQCNGGGVFQGNMNACRIIGNSTVGWDGHGGGGACGGILLNSTVVSNSVVLVPGHYGGGTQNSVVSNCTITCNQAGDGGGTSGGTVYNSLIAGNHAARNGGGVYLGTLYNCTIAGNWGDSQIGGVGRGNGTVSLINCIVYFNNCGGGTYPNLNTVDASTYITNTCTPGVALSNGNIAADPVFVGNGTGYGFSLEFGDYRLRGNSPCVDAGMYQVWMTGSVDLDGKKRIRDAAVDLGAYEYFRRGTLIGIR